MLLLYVDLRIQVMRYTPTPTKDTMQAIARSGAYYGLLLPFFHLSMVRWKKITTKNARRNPKKIHLTFVEGRCGEAYTKWQFLEVTECHKSLFLIKEHTQISHKKLSL